METVTMNGTGKSVNENGAHANGVSERNLKILIVGAGIGGLSAALGLRRAGHEVLVSIFILRLLNGHID